MMMERAFRPWWRPPGGLPCGRHPHAGGAHGRRWVDDAHDAGLTTNRVEPEALDDPFFDMVIPNSDLLAAFQFVLEVHHKAGRLGVLNFAAAGGDFAEALLKREVRRRPASYPDFPRRSRRRSRWDMEAGEFFADVELVREDDHFEGSGLPVHR